ncbi:hypothetical protein HMI54_006471 [Coelomomyces lativittatus]|nr:hypothetical protein HMI56_001531 [Coelomomyces lativittatus]KAJ1504926.1 hypothetical protein HMI54_006471 [Coelomomyces lativittatus]KAJ1511574.1 hypothetical protein HMI55_006534 [Coelomomyces lativittatus]
MSSSFDNSDTPLSTLQKQWSLLQRRIQHLLDKSIPFTFYRWFGWSMLLATFLLRVFFAQGWYIVTYALGIYLLNLVLLFLSPRWDPALQDVEDDDDEAIRLPTKNDDDFRPFIRRLPEFKFWWSATKAVLISILCTFFEVLNIPVFWPILVIYFCVLVTLTMRRQILHMIKYKYIPFNFGKRRYTSSMSGSSSSSY